MLVSTQGECVEKRKGKSVYSSRDEAATVPRSSMVLNIELTKNQLISYIKH